MVETEERPVADRLEGVPVPAQSMQLVGHDAQVAEILKAHAAGKLHHAWLISGPRGIGKSTLAFHVARHIMAHPDGNSAPMVLEPDSWPPALCRQIAQGAHPELLHLNRPWDEKTKKFKTKLSVDEIRRSQAFFGMTAGAGGWRIVIVDAADDMNANAANALLKILEEPPQRSLFFVITHTAGGLLPTIRSRCRSLVLEPLKPEEIDEAIVGLGLMIDSDKLKRAAELAEGSVRQTILLGRSKVMDHYATFEKLMGTQAIGSPSEWLSAHAIADPLSRNGSEEDFKLFVDLVMAWIGKNVRNQAGHVSTSVLAGWAEVWEKATRSVTLASAFNLDRKQVILSLFSILFERNKA